MPLGASDQHVAAAGAGGDHGRLGAQLRQAAHDPPHRRGARRPRPRDGTRSGLRPRCRGPPPSRRPRGAARRGGRGRSLAVGDLHPGHLEQGVDRAVAGRGDQGAAADEEAHPRQGRHRPLHLHRLQVAAAQDHQATVRPDQGDGRPSLRPRRPRPASRATGGGSTTTPRRPSSSGRRAASRPRPRPPRGGRPRRRWRWRRRIGCSGRQGQRRRRLPPGGLGAARAGGPVVAEPDLADGDPAVGREGRDQAADLVVGGDQRRRLPQGQERVEGRTPGKRTTASGPRAQTISRRGSEPTASGGSGLATASIGPASAPRNRGTAWSEMSTTMATTIRITARPPTRIDTAARRSLRFSVRSRPTRSTSARRAWRAAARRWRRRWGRSRP